MSTCHRCGHSFKGDELYCEPYEEYENQLRRELYGYFCAHCKSTMLPAAFDRHR